MSVVTHRTMQRGAASRLVRSTQANRSAFIEPLEGRMLMTVVLVNTTLDNPHPTGMVSLRDAVAIANASATPTTITFDANVFATNKTIMLNGNELGLAAKTTTINGPAAGVTIDGKNLSRIFHIFPGAVIGLSGLTLTHAGRGAILNTGTLTMSGGALTANSGSDGGGLDNTGVATLNNVTIAENKVTGYNGGGIYNSQSGTLYLANDTLSGNLAQAGGGLYNGGYVTLTNVTVFGNTAIQRGGGIDNYVGGTLWLTSVTVVGNGATNDFGGGLNIEVNQTLVKIADSIVAGNFTKAPGYGPDVAGPASSRGYNFIGKTDSSSGWANSDLQGTSVAPRNPHLGGLANNGGSTLTMLPLAGSDAIDAGNNGLLRRGTGNDQRGRTRIVNSTVDIGAVEVQFRVRPPIPINLLSGVVFADSNGNNLRETREAGLSDRIVYLDLDHNGTFDAKDIYTVTDRAGNWSFTNLVAGVYSVRLVPVDGQVAGTTTDNALTIKLAAGQSSTGNHFGESLIQ